MHHELEQVDVGWDTASWRGRRTVNADAVASRYDPVNGESVFAVADGVGDTPEAANAAQLAANAAVETTARDGVIKAILAARQAVASGTGDCVLVVAMPFADRTGGGYRIAWVGDCRAYLWDQRTLRLLTTDQTVAAYLRSRGRPTTVRMEHIVTNTVATTTVDRIGWTQVRTADAGLLLATDGVHKIVPTFMAHRELLRAEQPAHALTRVAAMLGGRDNATALVVDRAGGHGVMTQPTVHAVAAAS
ncbi:MAG: protein phosphatase 2C domain-containing protein [Kutzneria sp.]|nr:protein phosphatase 2C domain-containing protein [Kutzneria sp.]